jgi:hypothetical protein
MGFAGSRPYGDLICPDRHDPSCTGLAEVIQIIHDLLVPPLSELLVDFQPSKQQIAAMRQVQCVRNVSMSLYGITEA